MKKSTILKHAGRMASERGEFVNPPVSRGSTMLFPTLESLYHPPRGYGYGRHGSPAGEKLAEIMLELEGGSYARFASSGMAAIAGVISGLGRQGDHLLLPDNVFSPTRNLCDRIIRNQGVEVEYYAPLIGEDIGELVRPNTRLVYVETPGSASFEVADLGAIAKAARKANENLLIAVDNSWATPLFLRPLEHGADIVIHAATKYITGHSDAMLGMVIANERAERELSASLALLGMCPGSLEVDSALKGLRTLDIRLDRHQQNGLELARWLEEREEVDRVLHPALPSCPGHETWKRCFDGASGLFGFVLGPGPDEALEALFGSLELFGMGWSWGGYESLLVPMRPASSRTVEPWREKGHLLRIHAGLEDVEDLKNDLGKALERWRHKKD